MRRAAPVKTLREIAYHFVIGSAGVGSSSRWAIVASTATAS